MRQQRRRGLDLVTRPPRVEAALWRRWRFEAQADMGMLWRSMTDADKKQVTSDANNVLNGIAYDKATETFYVTGKRWRTIFVGKFSPHK